jgi:hypothetical protein
MAMLGFAGIALTELNQQVPAAEQFANDVSGVALLAVTLTFASIFPKFVSGCSLKVRCIGVVVQRSVAASRKKHSTSKHMQLWVMHVRAEWQPSYKALANACSCGFT